MASKFGVDEFFCDDSLFPSEDEDDAFAMAVLGLPNAHPLFLLRRCPYAGNLPSSPEDDDTRYDDEAEDKDDDV